MRFFLLLLLLLLLVLLLSFFALLMNNFSNGCYSFNATINHSHTPYALIHFIQHAAFIYYIIFYIHCWLIQCLLALAGEKCLFRETTRYAIAKSQIAQIRCDVFLTECACFAFRKSLNCCLAGQNQKIPNTENEISIEMV